MTYESIKSAATDHGCDTLQLSDGSIMLLDAMGDEGGWNRINPNPNGQGYSKEDLLNALGY